MPTWCFKAGASRPRETGALQWYWQIDTNHAPITITSTSLFSSLPECIADARTHGFRGEVPIPANLDEASVITCEEGGYVHAVVAQSIQDRANRLV